MTIMEQPNNAAVMPDASAAPQELAPEVVAVMPEVTPAVELTPEVMPVLDTFKADTIKALADLTYICEKLEGRLHEAEQKLLKAL